MFLKRFDFHRYTTMFTFIKIIINFQLLTLLLDQSTYICGPQSQRLIDH